MVGDVPICYNREKLFFDFGRLIDWRTILDVSLPMDQATGGNRGYAFIAFSTQEEACDIFRLSNENLLRWTFVSTKKVPRISWSTRLGPIDKPMRHILDSSRGPDVLLVDLDRQVTYSELACFIQTVVSVKGRVHCLAIYDQRREFDAHANICGSVKFDSRETARCFIIYCRLFNEIPAMTGMFGRMRLISLSPWEWKRFHQLSY